MVPIMTNAYLTPTEYDLAEAAPLTGWRSAVIDILIAAWVVGLVAGAWFLT